MFKWVLNTFLNKKKFFHIRIVGNLLFKCKENWTNDVKEARKHVSTKIFEHSKHVRHVNT